MAIVTAGNNGSLYELMDKTRHDIKAALNLLTAHVQSGDRIVHKNANNRGFRISFDATRLNSFATPDPSGAMATPDNPELNNFTANLQYLQVGKEVGNLQLANSPAWAQAGPSAVETTMVKAQARFAEMEEWYFCRGDGTSQMGVVTGTAATTLNTPGTVALAGTGDGAGSYVLGPGQYIRVYDSSLAFKHSGYIAAKTSNTSISYVPTLITTTGVVAGDLILPQGVGTAGMKGLPYLVKPSGAYFNRTIADNPGLAGVIDSSTTTMSRTTLEALYRNSKVRAGRIPKQINVVSEAQLSNYYAQFYAQNTAQVHVVGNQLPGIDLGGANSPDDYTFWRKPIYSFSYVHPKNWWMLDMSSFYRLRLKDRGPTMTPAGSWIQKIASGEYYNAQQAWDDDFVEYCSPNPARNAGMTNLSFSSLPGLLVNSTYTGSQTI